MMYMYLHYTITRLLWENSFINMRCLLKTGTFCPHNEVLKKYVVYFLFAHCLLLLC